MTSEPFWYEDPSVLLQSSTWHKFVPTAVMSTGEALNAVMRFVIYFSIMLFISTMEPVYLMFIPVVSVATIVLHGAFPKTQKMTEEFVSSYMGEDRSLPTADNPFMNPSLTDILDNPARPPAADITKKDVRNKVNKSFAQTSNLYMDTTDVYTLVQAQRNFYTVPEDDHEGLLKFLGKNAKSDKLLSEGYVVAKGTVPELPTPSVTAPPKGTALRH